MIWLRCVGWFVFLLLLLCPITAAEGDEKVIVEDFDGIYYMEDTGSVEISTEITFVGDNYNDGDIPIEVFFYGMDRILLEEDVNPNKVRTKVWMDGTTPVYEYHNYTATFGFETNLTGDLELRIIVTLGNYQEFDEVYTIHMDPGFNPSDNPDPATQEVFFTSTMVIIFIIIIIVMTVMSIAAGKVVMERRELSSERSIDLEMNPTDTELEMSMDDDMFKIVPDMRDKMVLKSRTSHSEIELDEV